MEFTALPPEVTSALIHSGPGAESLFEASNAWQRLGTSLEESAGINSATLSSLTGAWHGPSAAAMTEAVEPYLDWLRTTAQQCQQMAVAVQDAIAAFNSARSSVVPVASVSANRTRLTQLLATNRFGINLPAIAETEERIPDMWANNSAAMSRYRGGLGTSHHAAPVRVAACDCQFGGDGCSGQCGRPCHFCDARCSDHHSAIDSVVAR